MKFQESETIELKRSLTKDFAKEVVAFLNTRSGTIYIGVDDNGNVLCVSNVDKTMREIRDIIRDQILPSTEGLCEIGSLLEEDKTIIVVKVTKGTKLYYIKKEGRSATGCFYRDGTFSTPMSEEEIERRFIKTYSKHLSMVETPSSQKEFSFKQLKIYYSSKGYHLNDETLVDNLHLKTDDGKYNFLAELLSDTNRVSIKVARFQGVDKSTLIEKSEYGYQCLLVAIDRVINRLEAENITKSKIVGAQRVDKRLMDMPSLREVFINAIAHNDWSIIEPAVYIFSNHIEVISHGGLPDGETKEMFFKGISTPRNKELMRVLSDLKYVEQTGYGVPEVLKHYDKNVFDIEENYINVSIPYDAEVMASMRVSDVGAENGEENSEENGEEKLIALIQGNPKISLFKMAKELNVTSRIVERMIRNCKRIKRVGPDKGGHWEIVEEDK